MSIEAVSLLYQTLCITLVFTLSSVIVGMVVPVRRWVESSLINHALALFLTSLLAAYINKVAL